MSGYAKIIEMSADSEQGFDDAVQQGLKRAGETLVGVRSACVKDHEVHMNKDGRLVYRVNLKVAFRTQ